MPVGNIKGIVVEIGGDTGPLSKALQGVNATSKDLQTELKAVNTGLKFDPSNTVLLEQKQKLLADAIQGTKDKLVILKTAEEQVQDQFAKGKISEEQYRALQREIVTTEQKLKGLETQALKANGALTSDQAVGNLKKIGVAVGAAALAAGAAFVAMGVAELANADKVQQTADVYGLTAERVQELQYVGTKLDVELETMTKAQSMLTKAMYAAKDGTGAQSDAFKALGVSVTNSDGSLRNSQDVMAESFVALGKMTNETERDAMAQKLFGKSAMELNPLIKASADEIAGLTKEAHDTGAVLSNEAVAGLDGFGDSMEAAKVSVMGMVGSALSKLLPYINDLIKGLTELPAWIDKNSNLLTVIGIAIGTLVTAFIAYNIVAAFTVVTTTGMTAAGMAFGAALLFIQSSVVVWILAIGALIAIGVLLYKNWDTVSAFLTATWTAISQKATEIFNAIAAFFTNTWNGITSKVTGVWNGIANFFTTTWTNISTGIVTAWNAIPIFFTGLWNSIKNTFMDVINGIVTFVTTTFSKQTNDVYVIFLALQRIFVGVWEIIKNVFLGAILLIIDLVTGNFTKLKEDAANIFDSLGMYFSDIWGNIKLIFTRALDLITTNFTQAWNGVVSLATTVWNGLGDFFVGLWNGITNTAANAWNGLKDAVSSIMSSTVSEGINIFNGILDFFWNLPGTLYNLGVNAFNGLIYGVSDILSGLWWAVSSGFNDAIGFITNLPGQAWQWGADIINGIVQGIRDAAWAVGNAVSGIAQTIRNFLHFSVPDEGPLVDFESWMPDFIGGLAAGITDSKWMVSDAIKGLSTDMSIGMNLTPTMAGIGSVGSAASQTVKQGDTNINFNGSYSFAGQKDIDYFMNQAAVLVQRRTG